tara:strand:- start:4720 stop:4881 length:162 start_codon:yes stop_codon:yes gene_type:complete
MQRLENESNEDFKLRRKANKVALKIKKMGYLHHDSSIKGPRVNKIIIQLNKNK